MSQAVFVGVVMGVAVLIFIGFVSLVKAGNHQSERTEQTFRAECAAINGRAVWNGNYWECLK